MTSRISFQQISIRIALFRNDLFRSICYQLRIHLPIIVIQAITKTLDISSISVKFIVNRIESIIWKLHTMFCKVSNGKTSIRLTINGTDGQQLRTLIERPFQYGKHFLHHILLTTRKNEVHIRQKLDRAPQSVYSFLYVFGNLLEFVDGNITSHLRRTQIIQYLFQCTLFLVGHYVNHHFRRLRSVRQE